MKTEREFKVILPKYDNEGHRINTDELKSDALKMARHFGGVTVLPSILGCYETNGELQCEENMMLLSVRDSSDEGIMKKDRGFINSLAKDIGKRLGQESVFVEEDIIQDVSFVAGVRKESVPKIIREKDFFKRLMD